MQASKGVGSSPFTAQGATVNDAAVAARISSGCAPSSAAARDLTYASTAIALLQPLRRSDASTIDHVTSSGDSGTACDAAVTPAVVEVINGLLLPVLSSPHVGTFAPQLAAAIAKLLLPRSQLSSFTSSLLQSAAAAASAPSGGVSQASPPSDSQIAADREEGRPADVGSESMRLNPTAAQELFCSLLLTAAAATLEQSSQATLEQSSAASGKDLASSAKAESQVQTGS